MEISGDCDKCSGGLAADAVVHHAEIKHAARRTLHGRLSRWTLQGRLAVDSAIRSTLVGLCGFQFTGNATDIGAAIH